MSFAERVIKEHATKDPPSYAKRVRWMVVIYFVLNAISIAIIVTIAWRVQFFVTLTQRSNVETLTLAIIFILAVYYLLSTFKGFIGALRILWLNSPLGGAQAREDRKHRAISTGGPSKYVCFDQAIEQEGKPGESIRWDVGDEAGKLGEIEVEGVKATYYPIKKGMNNSLFEFLADQIEKIMRKRDLDATLSIAQWSTISEDTAAAYFSMVQAFENIETHIQAKGHIWPTVVLSQEDVDEVGGELRKLVPTLRDESLLPDLEYEVEYNIPVIPEPLALLRLTRRDNRADPIITMGCAGITMLALMALLTFVILLPPWVPPR